MTSVPSSLTRRPAVVVYVAVVSALAIAASLYVASARQGAAGSAVPKTVVRTVWPTPSPSKPTSTTASKKPWPAPAKSTVVTHKSVLIGDRQPNESGDRASTIADGLKHCWDFTWQQDAQAAYVANLADPGGLDGLAGPANGNGIACEQLPVDPSRPKSTPVDAAKPTATADVSRDTAMAPTGAYFGMASDELPGSTAALDTTDSDVGKAPGLIEFFDTWDHDYLTTGAKVRQSWERDAFPVLTWMPEPLGGTYSSDLPKYTLDHILDGSWDTYLYQWALQVVQTGLPMGLRFAHEMNGYWYPWSAGLQQIKYTGNKILTLNNTPAKYIAAWRHVWQIFQNVGANAYTVWIWTPVTSLCTQGSDPNAGGYCSSGYTTYAEDYPGENYVDWIGLSSYAYSSPSKYTFAGTFKTSLTALAGVSDKPVFIAETGAAERVTTPGAAPQTFASAVSRTALKAQWTQQTLAGFLQQGTPGAGNYLNTGQRVVGFVLFNNYVPDVHKVAGAVTNTETDWRWNSSPDAAAAFRKAIADVRYQGGTMPATLVTTFPDPDAVRWPVVAVTSTSSAPSSTSSTSPSPATSTSAGSPSTSASPSPTPSGSVSASPTPSATSAERTAP